MSGVKVSGVKVSWGQSVFGVKMSFFGLGSKCLWGQNVLRVKVSWGQSAFGVIQLSLRDSNRLDEVRCSLTFDRSRFLNSPGLFTQMHIILHESVLSGHILLNKIFRFSLIFQTRLQKVDKIFRVL